MTTGERMPAVFIGHGTPFNALNDNRFTQAWSAFGRQIPRPKAILAVSAHWYIGATAATAMPKPPTVHDFYGFPPEMYQISYPAPGAPELVSALQELVAPVWLQSDTGQWGLDHGTWSVLVHMFPEADIPVVQLSIDGRQAAGLPPRIGQKPGAAARRGRAGDGLGQHRPQLAADGPRSTGSGPEWASRYDAMVQRYVQDGDDEALVEYERQPDAELAVPTPDHYLPLLYAVGLRQNDDACDVIVDGLDIGCVSMTSLPVPLT